MQIDPQVSRHDVDGPNRALFLQSHYILVTFGVYTHRGLAYVAIEFRLDAFPLDLLTFDTIRGLLVQSGMSITQWLFVFVLGPCSVTIWICFCVFG